MWRSIEQSAKGATPARNRRRTGGSVRARMAATGTPKTVGWALLGAAALALGVAGCPPHEYVMIQTGIFPSPYVYHNTLKWTREGSAQINTYHDYELART